MNIEQQRASESGQDAAIACDGRNRLVDKPWVVLGLLFFVTLFLGLPLLWLSPRFSTLSKIAISIANLAYSAIVLWGFYLLLAWCYSRISNALQGF